MTDYEKTRDALARNILVDRDGASIVVQRRGNLLVGARQRANLGTALDDAHRENAVDVAKAGNLRVAAPAQHVGGLGKLGFLCPDWSRKRSEERRVGNERVCTCGSRWWPD